MKLHSIATFNHHHLAWAERSPENHLAGKSRTILSGETAEVLAIERASGGVKRVLVKLDTGHFSWADSTLLD